ncbi:hypothetical protein ACQCRM_17355, partial [Ralstonia pseudosolanacearum]
WGASGFHGGVDMNNSAIKNLADGTLHTRLAGLGLQAVDLGDGELRGHTFHYSSLATPLAPATHARRAHGAGNAAPGEAVYRHGSIVASYLHAYFPSNPTAAARLFRP